MGGGDLNMKKSWHPLLQVNQERVWKREKEALEERKKLEELRREREQEREMQELQRLQEEAGGKKRIHRVDWMYATPATTGSNSAAEMEEYLLGKKRVDKLLRGDEAEKVSKNSQQNLISLQDANSARDLAAKVREDPMLAIKQQEQAAYEALLRDPARLRQLKLQAGIDVNKESKEEKRRRKEEKRRRHDDDDGHKRRRYGDDDRDSDRRHRSRHSDSRGDSHSHRHGEDRDGKSRDRDRSPCRDGESSSHRRHHDEHRSSRRHHDSERCRRERARPPSSHKDNEKHRSSRHSNGEYSDRRSRSRSRSVSPVTDRRRQDDLPPRFGDSYRPQPCSRDPRFRNGSSSASTRSREEEDKRKEEIQQQKLREMEQNARSMEEQRTSFVSKINAEEAEQDRKEAELRQKLIDAKAKGHSDGRGGFLLDQQRKTFGDSVDLAERMRRDRGRLQRMD